MYSTYTKALIKILSPGAEALLKAGLISFSFNGASVLLCSTNSVAALFIEFAPHASVFHAVAHRREPTWVDACAEVPFILLISEVYKKSYATLSVSLKNNEFKEMAGTLGEEVASMKDFHGSGGWLPERIAVSPFFEVGGPLSCFSSQTP